MACSRSEVSAPPPPQIAKLADVQNRIEEYRGQPLLVNFWATWCGPCVKELPDFVSVAQAHAEEDLRYLTISYDYMIGGVDEAGVLLKVQTFLDQTGLPMEVLIFDEDDYDGINTALDLPGPIPVTLAFDASGKEVGRLVDESTREQFEELARLALGIKH